MEAEIYKNLLITIPTFFDFRFQKLNDFKDFKYDFRKSVRDLATVGDPLAEHPQSALQFQRVLQDPTLSVMHIQSVVLQITHSSLKNDTHVIIMGMHVLGYNKKKQI